MHRCLHFMCIYALECQCEQRKPTIMHKLKMMAEFKDKEEEPDHGSPVQIRKTNQYLDLRRSFALSTGYSPPLPKSYCPGVSDNLILLSFLNLLLLNISLSTVPLRVVVLSFLWATSYWMLLLWLTSFAVHGLCEVGQLFADDRCCSGCRP